MVKNLPGGAGDIKDMGLIPGRKIPWRGDSNPLPIIILSGKSHDQRTWWAVVHRIAGSDSTEGLDTGDCL